MCVANVFAISDSHSMSDEFAVVGGSCKTSFTDISLSCQSPLFSHIQHRYFTLSDGHVSMVSSGL